MNRIKRALARLAIWAFGQRIECPVCQEGRRARVIGDAYVCPDGEVAGPMSLAEARRCAENWRAWLESRCQR